MGADADQHLPLVVPSLTRVASGCGSGRLARLTFARLLDLLLGAVVDEDRLAAPEHLDHLALGDRAEIDLDRRAGRDGRSIRIHLRDQRHKRRPRHRPRRRRRSRCRGNRGVSARPKSLSRASGPLLLPVQPTRAADRETPKHPDGGERRAAPGPGEGRMRRSGGVYWHPCRQSASPHRGVAQVTQTALATRISPCGPTFGSILSAMRIALYEPDIAQNTGTILRLAACLGSEAHIIEPAGFPVSDRAFRRAGMDYLDQVTLTRHASWAAFDAWRRGRTACGWCCSPPRAATLLSRPPYRRRRAAVRPRIVRRAAEVHEAADAG